MTYSLLDRGDLVATFDTEHAARKALDRLAREAGTREGLLLTLFDASGDLVSEWAPAPLPPAQDLHTGSVDGAAAAAEGAPGLLSGTFPP